MFVDLYCFAKHPLLYHFNINNNNPFATLFFLENLYLGLIDD